MNLVLLILEIMLLSGLMVGCHAAASRFGPAAFHVVCGVVWSFLLISDTLTVNVVVPGGWQASYASLTHFCVIMMSIVVVYTLGSPSEARQLIGAILFGTLVQLLLKVLLTFHLDVSSLGVDELARWTRTDVVAFVAGSIALAIDGLVVVVVFQSLVNVMRKVPLVVIMAMALLAAMITDGLIFGLLRDPGRALWTQLQGELIGKALAAFAASIPAGLYVWRNINVKQGGMDRASLITRGTFDIVMLQRQLETTQLALQETQASFDFLKRTFSRYVVSDVVDEIVSRSDEVELGGEEKIVTILFSDIRGYSTISEHLSPTQVIGLLNQYFGAMSDILDDERGTIIEFEGDAILAVFGAPLEQVDHATRAVRTAVRMLDEVDRLNQRWTKDGTAEHWRKLGIERFRVRIGVHSGKVVVGHIGSETRTKYAVIGDTVNTASRVEGLNKELDTDFLFTRATLDAMSDTPFPLQPMGKHAVRGRIEDVEVFGVRRDKS